MNPQPYTKPTGRWEQKLNPRLMRLLRPARRRILVRKQRMKQLEVIGAEHLLEAKRNQYGLLLTPNHAFHYDSNVLLEVGDRIGCPLTFMTAWQVFAMSNRFNRWLMRRHGCFSVDRDGVDVAACKQAMKIVREGHSPLVIFPEGEIFHSPDHVLPFREGAAVIALGAARRAERPVACVPVAMRIEYLRSPEESIAAILSRVEIKLGVRTSTGLTSMQRSIRCARKILTSLETQYLGSRSTGSLKDRASQLQYVLLERLETELRISKRDSSVLERISSIRKAIIEQQGALIDDGENARQLETLFICTQLLSYNSAEINANPTLEQVAGFVEKLEEDVFGSSSPSVMGDRKVVVSFGEPVLLQPGREQKTTASELTLQLQQQVQTLLDESKSSGQTAERTTLWKPMQSIIPAVRRSSKPR